MPIEIRAITRAKTFVCLIIRRTEILAKIVSCRKAESKKLKFCINIYCGFIWFNSLCVLQKLFCVKGIEFWHLDVWQRAGALGIRVLGGLLHILDSSLCGLLVWHEGRGGGCLTPFAVAVVLLCACGIVTGSVGCAIPGSQCVLQVQEDLEMLGCLQRGSECRHQAHSQLEKPLPVHQAATTHTWELLAAAGRAGAGSGKVEKFRENNKAFSSTLFSRIQGHRRSPADILCRSYVLSLAIIVYCQQENVAV